MHVTDLLPTLASATGTQLGSYMNDFDGVDQWDALKSISNDSIGVRKRMLYNIDDVFRYSAYMEDGWKVIEGTTSEGKFDKWLGDFINPEEKLNSSFYASLIKESLVHQSMPENTWLDDAQILKIQKASEVICDKKEGKSCNALEKPCLFDLLNDPCEYNNLAASHKNILKKLLINLGKYRQSALPIRNQPPDYNANPKFFNDTWTYWQETPKVIPENFPQLPILLVLSISGITLLVIFFSIAKQRKKSLDGIPKISSKICLNNNNVKETSLVNMNNEVIEKSHL